MHQTRFTGVIVLALCSACLCGINLTLIGALETWVVDDLSISHGRAGWMQSCFLIGSVLGSLVAGWALYTTNARTVGVLSLLVTGAGSMLSGIPWYAAVLVGRLTMGLGNAGSIIFFSTMIVHCFKARQTMWFNVFHAVLAFGAVVTLVGGRPVGVWGGSWSVPFWIAAAMGCLLAIGTARIALPKGVTGPRLRMSSVRRILGHPVFLVSFFLFVGYNMAEQGLVTFFPAYGEQERGFSVEAAAWSAAAYWIGVGVGRAVSALAVKKTAERRVLIGGTVLGALLLLCSLVMQQFFGAIAVVFAAGFVVGPLIPVAFSYVVRKVGYLEATVLSLCNVVCCIGGASGPVLSGYIADRCSSLLPGLIVVFSIFLVGILPLAMLTARQPHPSPPAE